MLVHYTALIHTKHGSKIQPELRVGGLGKTEKDARRDAQKQMRAYIRSFTYKLIDMERE